MAIRTFADVKQHIERLNAAFAKQARELAEVRAAAAAATTAAALAAAAAAGSGALVNLLPNSDLNFSKDAWVSGPPKAGGDIDFEAYNFYRFPDTDTLLVEDAAHALKAVGHSLYAANEGANADIPDWDKTNGIVRIGSAGATNWMIATPFVVHHARPSGELQFQMIVKLLGALALPDDVGLAVWVHDNTAGQEKPLEGGDLELDGAVVGTAGATSTEYFLVAITDFGQEYKSNLETVATAPAVLDGTNYVALSWTRVPGVKNYDLYRQRGGVIKKIAQIRNGQTSYWDQGAEIETVGAYPAVTLTKPRAYVEIPSAKFNPTADEWAVALASIVVPFNYNSALTTGKQWLVIKPTAATAAGRQLQLDHFGLGEQYGRWSKSFYDAQAKNNVSTTATESDQGNIGTGGGGAPIGEGEGEGGRPVGGA